MSQLTVNGIEVPVGASGWADEFPKAGDDSRSQSGRALGSIRRRWRKHSGSFLTSDTDLAEALRVLINGDGLGWGFDAWSFASDGTGVWRNSATGSSVSFGAHGGASPLYGTGMLVMDAAATCTWTHGNGSANWTMAVWTWESGAWHHYFVRSDTAASQHYKDGALVSSAKPAFMACTATTISLAGDAGAERMFDDMIYLPCLAPVTWAATIYGYGAAWPKPPLLAVAGSLREFGSGIYRGSCTRSEGSNRGALDRLERVAFTLEED